ncbi:MAG: DUF4382 domain-containing protein, partial [Bacteroidota bacterium]
MKKLILGLFLGAAMLSSCDKNEEKATLNVRLTDAPAAYEEVIINVTDVKINVSAEDESGWQSMENVSTGEYNLLDFTNGLDTLLASQELPAGKISQMRLILGDGNKVKIDGEYFDLDTPSSQQSGLKFNIHADLAEGVVYNLWIDFDAKRSIVEKGNGGYSLKPVIRTFTEATSGAIKGIVSPVEAQAYIMAISASQDTLGTYADTESGEFLIRGSEEGVYSVEFVPVDGFEEKTINDVLVVTGEVTDMGTIDIEEEVE